MKFLTVDELIAIKEEMKMTILGEMIRQDGIEIGRKDGIKIGKEEGLARGIQV